MSTPGTMCTIRIHVSDGQFHEWQGFPTAKIEKLLKELSDDTNVWVSIPSDRGTTYFFRQHVTLLQVINQ